MAGDGVTARLVSGAFLPPIKSGSCIQDTWWGRGGGPFEAGAPGAAQARQGHRGPTVGRLICRSLRPNLSIVELSFCGYLGCDQST